LELFFNSKRCSSATRKLLIERDLRMVLKLKQGKMQLDTIRTQIQQGSLRRYIRIRLKLKSSKMQEPAQLLALPTKERDYQTM
jgi:hypothetical protein